jgi:hypothetical protein
MAAVPTADEVSAWFRRRGAPFVIFTAPHDPQAVLKITVSPGAQDLLDDARARFGDGIDYGFGSLEQLGGETG